MLRLCVLASMIVVGAATTGPSFARDPQTLGSTKWREAQASQNCECRWLKPGFPGRPPDYNTSCIARAACLQQAGGTCGEPCTGP